MSDPTKPAEGTTPAAKPEPSVQELLKNHKAETDRKLDNVLSQLKQSVEALNKKPASPQAPTKPLGDLIIEDPDKAVEVITEKVRGDIDRKQAYENRRQQVMQEIYKDFPEAADTNSELFKAAAEKWNKLSQEEQASNYSLKGAILEAATELDLRPKSKRQAPTSEADSFTMGGYSGSSSLNRGKGKDDLPSEMTEFAKIMGINPDDPKVKERLKERSNRKWGSYQPINKK